MNAQDVIESYVTDVAVKLPRAQRDDVAFELRALLHEELLARAEAAGSVADAAMATELVRAFGDPRDVAARYRPTLTIIDPSDGHAFVRAAVVGLVIIWGVGLVKQLQESTASVDGMIRALSIWWGTSVIPSLWWPGVLVVGFGAAAWGRRRSSNTSKWKPREVDRVRGGSTGTVMLVVAILFGVSVLIDPRWLLFGGRSTSAAFEGFTYTDTFRHRQAPWLLALLLLNVPLLIAAMIHGRWTATTRRIGIGLSLATCAMLVWTILDGPVLLARDSDQVTKPVLGLIVVMTLIDIVVRQRRSVRPRPGKGNQP